MLGAAAGCVMVVWDPLLPITAVVVLVVDAAVEMKDAEEDGTSTT